MGRLPKDPIEGEKGGVRSKRIIRSQEFKAGAAARAEGQPKADGGKFVPYIPASPADLAAAWDMPSEHIGTVMLSVLKSVPNTNSHAMVGQIAMEAYTPFEVARRWGPGTYSIQPSNAAYRGRTSTLRIDPSMALDAGFALPTEPVQAPGAYVPPGYALNAAASLRRMQDGTARELDMVQVFQTMMDATQRRQDEQFNKMVDLMRQANPSQQRTVEEQWAFFDRLQTRIEERMRVAVGLKPLEPEVQAEKPMTWETMAAGLAEALIPHIPAIITAITSRGPSADQIATAGRFNATMRVYDNPKPEETPAPVAVEVPLTEEEVKPMAGAIAMLKPFVDTLLKMEATGQDPAAMAKDLIGWVPLPLRGQIKDLAIKVQERGPDVLAIIDPRLATERWGQIIVAMGREV